MKIVVVGGSGRIGEKLVASLQRRGFLVVAASPRFGVDAVTGAGLVRALDGAEVLVDVSNPPSLDGASAIRFFDATGRRLAAAGRAAGLRHHIVLSVVGTDRLVGSGYFRAKHRQEELAMASGIPVSILRATQFFEFIAGVVQDGRSSEVAIAPAQVQPIAGADVADTLAGLATGDPLNGLAEVAGPERFSLPDLASEVLTAYEDNRPVIADPRATYFGATLQDRSLLPGHAARIGELRFEDWLRDSLQPGAASGWRRSRR